MSKVFPLYWESGVIHLTRWESWPRWPRGWRKTIPLRGAGSSPADRMERWHESVTRDLDRGVSKRILTVAKPSEITFDVRPFRFMEAYTWFSCYSRLDGFSEIFRQRRYRTRTSRWVVALSYGSPWLIPGWFQSFDELRSCLVKLFFGVSHY